MTLTHKERMQRAVRRESLDRLPTQFNYSQAMSVKLAAHLGVSIAELPALPAAFAGLTEEGR